ncbi:magnesium transporter [Microvirga sp. M2]|uniref:magnesium transporter n=1 Tax=Microvirga sp. M2 TaxID=3073270 RepID=UPI0039C05BAA
MENLVIASEDAALDLVSVTAKIAGLRAADVVDVLNDLSIDDAAEILSCLPFDRAIEVLDQPSLSNVAQIVMVLPRHQAVSMLAGMSADRAADALHNLEDPDRSELLRLLDRETRTSLQHLLHYPEDSAGSLMTTEFVSAPSNWTIAQVLHHIRMVERTRETVYAVYVLDSHKHTLVNAVSLRRLIAGDPHANVLTAAPMRKPITVSPMASRDEVTRLIAKYDLLAVPVVDARGHIRGIVTVDDVIDTMIRRTTEEVQRFGGMVALDEPYLRIGFWQMIRKRAGWLCVLFLSEMLTASVMQTFEHELEKALVLTLFIPLIMSSGGNSGSQATSLLIRALALRELRLNDWWRVALRELPTGLLLGTVLGAVGATRIALWQWLGFYDYGDHWMLIALTISAALIGIVTFGSMAGSMLPFMLQRVGFDPASASAPFVATLVDVTGIVIYFGIAAVILSGTLL